MVKAINHGKFYRVVKCSKCECTFGFSVSDLKPKSISSNKYYVNCPECSNQYFDETGLMDKCYPVEEE